MHQMMSKNGRRILLRSVRIADSQLLFEWINDRNLRILNAPYRPVSEAEHDAWIQSVLTRSDLVIFVIEEMETGQAIGTCQLLNIDAIYRSADLQIRIGVAEFLGKGLGSEAINLLVEHGFSDIGLNRIALQVFATNPRAIRAYQTNGFLVEGRLREAAFIDGKFVDVLCMGLLKVDRD
jgi:RimJ/RimL family protein N-acetyltransferase